MVGVFVRRKKIMFLQEEMQRFFLISAGCINENMNSKQILRR
jgi:hypothetical protein